MAVFDDALTYALGNEGTYSNKPNDPGGETYRGIARKRHPDWAGWATVDAARKRTDFPRCLDQDGQLQQLVRQFYEREGFWTYDRLKSQAVANKVFDMGVNMGPGQAIKLLQRAVTYVYSRLPDDGRFGPITLAVTNAAPEVALLNELRARQAWFYAITELHKPDALENETFVLGWMRRAVK